MGVFKLVVESIFGVGLFINAMLFIPQIIVLLRSKSTQGISLLTFAGFLLINVAVSLHAMFRHDQLLLWGTVPSIITCGFVTLLIIYYRYLRRN